MRNLLSRIRDAFWSLAFDYVIRPTVKSIIQEQFEEGLPKIFDKIDTRVPELVIEGDAGGIEQLIIDSTLEVIGRNPSGKEIETVIQQYSPLVAAAKRLIK